MSPDPPADAKRPTTREINDYLRSATSPGPNRMLTAWSMPIDGSVWYLDPLHGPCVEVYRHEIIDYVGMLKAAGIEPRSVTNIWRRDP